MTFTQRCISGLLVLFLGVSLQGCIPIVAVTGATAGGAVIYNKRSVKTMLKDKRISNETKSRINKDPNLKKQTHINATAYNGIVLLTGEALNDATREQAYQIASKVKGIRLIYNEVMISSLAGFRSRMRSKLLTSQVKAALLAKPGVRSTQITVTSSQHTVYLMGMVSRTQAALAATTASRVNGVKKVVKVFEYDN